MVYTLIGGAAVGTVLILVFLPALYVTWFRIREPRADAHQRREPAIVDPAPAAAAS